MKTLIIPFFVVLISCNLPEIPLEESKVVEEINYYEVGKEISAIAQSELLKNVSSAMQEGGPVYAIKYCNVHATPLTDSLSKQFGCNISRLSLKARNPENIPLNKVEEDLLNSYFRRSSEVGGLNDTIIKSEGSVIYYRPILIGMEACLKCHGQIDSDISKETYATLLELYPEDKAVGYKMGDFRGVWRLAFSAR